MRGRCMTIATLMWGSCRYKRADIRLLADHTIVDAAVPRPWQRHLDNIKTDRLHAVGKSALQSQIQSLSRRPLAATPINISATIRNAAERLAARATNPIAIGPRRMPA